MATDDKSYPPLITGRSPSFERAWRELRNPSPTGDPEVVAVLGRLAEAEENARQAAAAGAARMSDPARAAQLSAAAGAHEARGTALGELITALGGAPPRRDECRPILAHGADDVTRAPADADAIAVMQQVEQELAAEYQQAAQHPRLDQARREQIARLAM